MALAFTPVDGGSLAQTGQYSQTMYDVLLDTDYPTGGWPITPGEVGLGTIIMGGVAVAHRGPAGAAATSAFLFLFDAVAQKLQAFNSNGAAPAPLLEAAAGENALDTRTVRIMFYGF